MSARVYLDWNATTPPRLEVILAMGEVMRTAWANPASVHGDGRAARRHLEAARSAVASLFGYDGRDVVLTSGGTESNNLALRSAFSRAKGGVLVTSRAEHPSVVRVAEALASEGLCDVVWLGLEAGGVVRLGDVERALGGGDLRLRIHVTGDEARRFVFEPISARGEAISHALSEAFAGEGTP